MRTQSNDGKVGRRHGGFTLVELLVGIMSFSILALVIGGMLVFAFSSWRYNNREVEIQRDASLAMETIARLIREAPRWGVSTATNSIYFSADGETNITARGNQLLLNPGEIPLVRDSVLNFSAASLNDGSVRVILQQYDDAAGHNITLSGVYMPRNTIADSVENSSNFVMGGERPVRPPRNRPRTGGGRRKPSNPKPPSGR